MLTDDVASRIGAQIEELAGRVQQAAAFAALVKQGLIPASPTAAFVLPLGLRPRSEGEAATGAFTQMVDEVVGIVLVVKAQGDATGGKKLPTVAGLIAALIGALAGWGPDAAIGVFRLARGELLTAADGVIVYQLDFAIQDQIRVLT